MSVVFEGVPIKSFEPKDERFPAETTSACLIGCEIRNLANFPSMPECTKIDLSDNRIKEGLEHLVTACPNVEVLALGGNYLKTFESIEPLFKLEKLRSLDLTLCAVSDLDNFSEKVFGAIKSLAVLNGKDKDGKEIEDEDLYQQEDEEEGEGEDEGTFDFAKMLDVDNPISDGEDDDFEPENEEEEDVDIPSDEENEEEN